MRGQDSLLTDYCIVGFPKCGTSAMARFMDQSPGCHLAKLNGALESPYFVSGVDPAGDYQAGKSNGHKYSMYGHYSSQLRSIIASNPKVLMIFCIRDLGEVLLSWHAMHRKIAHAGEPANHVAASPEKREFFATCDVNAYFDQFAQKHLDHAKRLKVFINHFKDTKAVFVSQARMATDAGDVMRSVHKALGLDAGAAFYDSLPKGHVSPVPKKMSALAPHVLDYVREQNRLIMQQLARLPAQQNLTLYSEGSLVF